MSQIVSVMVVLTCKERSFSMFSMRVLLTKCAFDNTNCLAIGVMYVWFGFAVLKKKYFKSSSMLASD